LIADYLGLVAGGGPWRLFHPGDVYRPAGGDAELQAIDWAAILADHCRGAWGIDGEGLDGPLTAEQEWCLILQPTAIQNRHAIAAGRGAVRSRHLAPEGLQPQLRRRDPLWQAHCKMVAVECVTVLAPHGARTLMSLTGVDPAPPDPGPGGGPGGGPDPEPDPDPDPGSEADPDLAEAWTHRQPPVPPRIERQRERMFQRRLAEEISGSNHRPT
jgi:hypothetical protein